MKEKKELIEMTSQELREEIGRLTTTLNRVHDKNRRRKKALKDINRSVLIKNAHVADTIRLNFQQARLVTQFKERAEKAEEVMMKTHRDLTEVTKLAVGYESQVEVLKRRHGYETERDDNKLVPAKTGFFSRVFGHARRT
jgi:hypothetical protein